MQHARDFLDKLGPKLLMPLVTGLGLSGALLLLFSEVLLHIREAISGL